MYDFLANYGPIVLVLVVAYFLLLRPGQLQETARKDRLAKLKVNDEVVLEGGLFGRVSSIDEADKGILSVELAPKVKVRVLKSKVIDLSEPTLAQEAKSQGTAAPDASKDPKAADAAGKKGKS